MSGLFAGALATAALFAPSGASAAPPDCTSTTAFTPMGTPKTLDTVCQGVDPGATVTITQAPLNGAVPAAWPLVYTPNGDQHGFDQFKFSVANGAEASGQITVTVITNTRPSCGSMSASTHVGEPVTIKAADVACTDPDGAQRLLHTRDGDHGTVAGDPSAATYTPEPGYVGTDTFDYYLSDGLQDSNTGQITVTITPRAEATATPTPTPEATATATPVPTVSGTPTPTPPPAALADKTAPTVTLTAGKATIAKGVALTIKSNEAGTAKLTLAAGKNKASKSAKLVNGSTKVTLKLSAKARRALKVKKSVKATVTVVATDAAGNASTKKLSVTLKH